MFSSPTMQKKAFLGTALPIASMAFNNFVAPHYAGKWLRQWLTKNKIRKTSPKLYSALGFLASNKNPWGAGVRNLALPLALDTVTSPIINSFIPKPPAPDMANLNEAYGMMKESMLRIDLAEALNKIGATTPTPTATPVTPSYANPLYKTQQLGSRIGRGIHGLTGLYHAADDWDHGDRLGAAVGLGMTGLSLSPMQGINKTITQNYSTATNALKGGIMDPIKSLGANVSKNKGLLKGVAAPLGKNILSKALVNKVPVLGAGLGAYNAYNSFKEGDIVGGLLNSGGALSNLIPIPGLNWAAQSVFDVANAAYQGHRQAQRPEVQLKYTGNNAQNQVL